MLEADLVVRSAGETLCADPIPRQEFPGAQTVGEHDLKLGDEHKEPTIIMLASCGPDNFNNNHEKCLQNIITESLREYRNP